MHIFKNLCFHGSFQKKIDCNSFKRQKFDGKMCGGIWRLGLISQGWNLQSSREADIFTAQECANASDCIFLFDLKVPLAGSFCICIYFVLADPTDLCLNRISIAVTTVSEAMEDHQTLSDALLDPQSGILEAKSEGPITSQLRKAKADSYPCLRPLSLPQQNEAHQHGLGSMMAREKIENGRS